MLIAIAALAATGLAAGGIAFGVHAANAHAEQVAAQALADARAELADAGVAHGSALESGRAEHERAAVLLAAVDAEMLDDPAARQALETAVPRLAELIAVEDAATPDPAPTAASASAAGNGNRGLAEPAPEPAGSTADRLLAEAEQLDTRRADLVRRTQSLDERRDDVRAAAEGLIASAHAKGSALELPAQAGQESLDAFAVALGALAVPAADADLAALVTAYQDAWKAVVASDEAAQRAAAFPSPSGPDGPTYIGGVLIANKSYPLPSWYGNGLTPELVHAFDAMRADAAASGINLRIVSGFRSYATQQATYSRFVARDGKALADTYSARPGHSEHQSGLAIDVNLVDASFADTPEGIWVRDNAHRFGFVVRYPQGKEHITGYTFEPWHLRYLGADLASTLYSSGLTLEEYLGISSRYDY